MRFVAAIHLPTFRLVRCGVDPSEAVVLIAFERNADRVQVASPVAAEVGVQPGMTLAEARAMLPGLAHERLDPDGEVADLLALRDTMMRFSPAVAAVPPDALLVELEPDALPALRRYLSGVGHADACVALSPDGRASLVLARSGRGDAVVRAEAVAEALAPLPVASIDLAEDVLDALADAGIRTLGHFAALPAAALTGRFGAEAGELHALVRGGAPKQDVPILPTREEPIWHMEFPDPVDAIEPVLFVLNGLIRDCCATLDRTEEAASRVQVRFRLEEGEHLVPVRLGQAARGADRIFRLLRARLERVVFATPVVAVSLELLEASPWHPPQPGLFDRAHALEPLPELIARLQDALGAEAVIRAALVDTHRPEAAWQDGEADPVPNAKFDPAGPHAPVLLPRPRPPILLPLATPLRVAAAPSGRPRAVLMAHDWFPIIQTDGPERLSGEWWKKTEFDRDYWRVTLGDGRRAWIFRETIASQEGGLGLHRWYLHGWLDAGPPMGAVAPRRKPSLSSPPPRYAELVAQSNYSFTEGASFPEELSERAESLGLHALALTDRDGVYGAVRFHRDAKTRALPMIHGSLLTVRTGEVGLDEGGEGASAVALVQNLKGWGTLCRLLSHARGEVQKGRAELPFERLCEANEGLIILARGEWPAHALARLRAATDDRLYRAVSRRLDPGEDQRIDSLVAQDIPCVATGDVLMHDPSRRRLQDVLPCIRLGLTLDQAGTRLQPNGERVLRSPERAQRLFSAWPELMERTVEIADRCTFSLKELRYSYPREVVPEGYGALAWLRELVRRGLWQRYGGSVPDTVSRQVEYELAVIERMDFPAYFLTVHDLVRFARSRGILCQGRGSAANSAVCWALGITAVDPAHSSLLFERFISEERGEPPDIDVDFEHERREEVIQYTYEKYGRERAAMVNEVICYRGRLAMRDVGKAVGLGLDHVDRLAKLMDSWSMRSLDAARVREAGLDPADGRVDMAVELARQIQGFPRHTSIHVGGFVISDGPLLDRVPIEPASMEARTVIQWDKDDIDELGFVKVDLLSLGMLTAIRKCFGLMRSSQNAHYDLATIPRDDPAVYEMLCDADSIGVFQVESRAQQGMLPRLKPKTFYDLVIEVSIVRPGPIQGGMVHPYLRRRNGEEGVEYADPRLVPILARTLGVPIFQEQIMAMAVAVGGFTPGEADQLRRSMGAWRKRGGLDELSARLRAGLIGNGLTPEYAEQIQKQIQGFAEYGFPESHAASFAHLVYVSAWQRRHFPAAFCAALINAQPMGFYAPRTLVADAQRHGVEVRPVDVRYSMWDCTLEPTADGPALRLGLRLIRGFREEAARAIESARAVSPFVDLPDLSVRAGLSQPAMRALARADALHALPEKDGASRREVTWQVAGLWPGLFARLPRNERSAPLPVASAVDELQADYLTTGLSVDRHPVGLVRPTLDREGVVALARLLELPNESRVRIAGLVGIRQRPDTASGVVFLMLEDETGTANVVIWPKLYEKERNVIRGERLLRIQGVLQRHDGAISVVARKVTPLRVAPDVNSSSRDFR